MRFYLPPTAQPAVSGTRSAVSCKQRQWCLPLIANRYPLSALLILIVLALQPLAASAAPPQPLPYVQQVLTRADAGIAHAWNSNGALGTFFTRARLQWIPIVTSTFLGLVDTGVQIVDKERDLPERNACLHADLYLVERKMLQVQDELLKAERARNVTAILELKKLLSFLSVSYNTLAGGATDPTASDADWALQRDFDPAPPTATGFCCVQQKTDCQSMTADTCAQAKGTFSASVNQCVANGCDMPADQPQYCPFNADYLPPNMEGYGCDVEAMTQLLRTLPNVTPRDREVRNTVQAELNGLATVQVAAEEYRRQAKAYDEIQRNIDAILKGDTPPPVTPVTPPRTHQQFVGCLTPMRCQQVGDETCKALLNNAQRDLRGPFNLVMNQLSVLDAFRSLRLQQAASRPPAAWTRASTGSNIIFQSMRSYYRGIFATFSTAQADDESLLFALGADPHLSIGDSLRPLRDSVQRLSRLVYKEGGGMGGLRTFVRDFAYFLRRSCLERPCNERLDRVLKIVFQDKCFPYTNGDYVTAKEAEECKRAAGLGAITP